MAKAIKLYTDGHIAVVDVPADKSLLDWFYEQIGCSCIENVYPRGLKDPYMLVMDEEALLKDSPVINYMASWLYETHKHGHPICGTVLVMQRVMTSEGPDIGEIPEKEASELAVVLALQTPGAVIEVRKRMGERIIA